MTVQPDNRPAPPRFLVCAGSTRERLDRVRDWGNIFTGGTGFDLARALAAYGPVDLVTSNTQHLGLLEAGALTAHPMRGFAFRSHADLRARLDQRVHGDTYDAICMSAAVSDYSPSGCFAVTGRRADADGGEVWTVRDVQAGKVSSSHRALAVLGSQTEKLVDLLRPWGFRGLLVKFKLEVGIDEAALLRVGETSRQASTADLLVANTLEMVEGVRPGAWLLGDGEPRWMARSELARTVSTVVVGRLQPGLAAEPATPALAAQLASHCRLLASVVEGLPDAAFADRSAGSSIGEHVRHSLDHLQAIVRGLTDGRVDYECRRRGWAGERDVALANGELHDVAANLSRLTPHDLLRPLLVVCSIDPASPPVVLPSTLARELLFGLSHEVHHAALLVQMLARHGCTAPVGFGVAPSTQAFRNGTACAASA